MAERVKPEADKAKDKDGVEIEVEDETPDASAEEEVSAEEPEAEAEEDVEDEQEPEAEAEDPVEEETVVQGVAKDEVKVVAPPAVGVKSAIIPDMTPETQEMTDAEVQAQKLSDHILDSPQPFGIWINGKLHTFRKGRQQLTNEQKDACLNHRYVRDNGASIIRMVKKAKPK